MKNDRQELFGILRQSISVLPLVQLARPAITKFQLFGLTSCFSCWLLRCLLWCYYLLGNLISIICPILALNSRFIILAFCYAFAFPGASLRDLPVISEEVLFQFPCFILFDFGSFNLIAVTISSLHAAQFFHTFVNLLSYPILSCTGRIPAILIIKQHLWSQPPYTGAPLFVFNCCFAWWNS